jgi:putative sterol carrier protein
LSDQADTARIDPQNLDPAALDELVDGLDAETLSSLVQGLDTEAINALIQRADPETAKKLIRKVDPGTFDLSGIDPAAIDSELFDTEMVALVVGATPEAKLAEAMDGPLRDVIVSEVFRRMPERVNKTTAGAVEAVIAWTITRPGGEPDRYVVTVDKGTATVEKGTAENPRVSLELGPVTFLRLVTGNANPVTAFMAGEIVIQGDLMFAASVATLFEIPTGVTREPPAPRESPSEA